MQENFARVIVYRDGDSFIAQCLEYDISAHAKDEETLRKRFMAVFNFERNLSIERNGAPFAGIGSAPTEFEEMWRHCEANGEMNISGSHIALAKCA